MEGIRKGCEYMLGELGAREKCSVGLRSGAGVGEGAGAGWSGDWVVLRKLGGGLRAEGAVCGGDQPGIWREKGAERSGEEGGSFG